MVGTSAGFDAASLPHNASAGALRTAGASMPTRLGLEQANAAVGAALGSTLEYKYQLAGHVSRIEAATYNSRRHHVLTADASSLRLWSLRKELRRVPTPCKQGLRHALHLALHYCEAEDVYVAAFDGDPSLVSSNTDAEDDNGASAASSAPPAYTLAGEVRVYHASLSVLLSFAAETQAPLLDTLWLEHTACLVTCGAAGMLRVWQMRIQGRSALALQAQAQAEA